MTYREVDRALVDWLVGEEHHAAYLDDVLAVTRRTRQRAAWSFPGRWIPVQLTLQRVAIPRWLPYAVVLALLALATAIALALFGAPRPLPAPFGPAANGLLTYSVDGDIVVADPLSGRVSPLVTGSEVDSMPAFSRDGTKVAFAREVPGGRGLFVVSSDGGTPVRLGSTPAREIVQISWSPDGSRIALVVDGKAVVVAANAGQAETTLSLGSATEADYLAWRPPDGRQILFRGKTPAGPRLYLAKLDGSEPTAITAPVAEDELTYIFPEFAPAGTRLIAQRPYPGGFTAFDLESGGTTVTGQTPVGVPDGWAVAFAPHIAPDGLRVSMIVAGPTSTARIAVVDLASPASVILTGPPFYSSDVSHAWSPDGKRVLFRDVLRNVWLLDPAGGPPVPAGLEDVEDPDWQRVAFDASGTD